LNETNTNDVYQPSSAQMWFPAMVSAGATEDNNVNNVIEAYKQRAKVGFKKYGTTTERQDIDFLGWLQHLQEELMDAVVYIERAKQEVILK
jgi:hypothetical protein